MQTLEIFHLGTHCAPKAEDFNRLRNKFLQSNNFVQHTSASALSTEEDSICPSNASEISTSTLLPARRRAIDWLDFLEDVSPQSESTFSTLARVVMASVAVDDNAKSGCVISQSRELVGTSRWTVDLWRRACVALARLGRYADLWPNLTRSSKSPGSNSPQDAVKEMLDEFTNSRNSAKSEPGRFNFKGSFGAQLAVPFVSPKSFEEVYRKFAVACIFFQSCSGAKRASLFISLELADFYRFVLIIYITKVAI